MCKYLFIDIIMQKNAAVLTAVCILWCLTFNYTFPLQRQSTNWSLNDAHYGNHSKMCHNVAHRAIVDRTKKMASNIESALKKIKGSTQDIGKNIYGHINAAKFSGNKNTLTDENLRQYEQLVIMKKYPYLDLNELDLKYSPSSKNVRQLNLEVHSNFDNEPSLCEQQEEGPNVEIYNRGLSGFSIPSKPKSKNTGFKMKLNTDAQNIEHSESRRLTKLASNYNRLRSLRSDINNFEERKITLD